MLYKNASELAELIAKSFSEKSNVKFSASTSTIREAFKLALQDRRNVISEDLEREENQK